jgi:hypothetical protein
MSDYHEPTSELSGHARDCVRALRSLIEEVEAVNWYHQRVDVTSDAQLSRILAHNRDEEMEHAAMALEWLRRNMPGWNEVLKTYLFTSEDITEIEEGEDEGGESGDGSLGIGKMSKEDQ